MVNQGQMKLDLNWNNLQSKVPRGTESKHHDEPEELPVMNNKRLEKFSSQYLSDKKEKIE